MNRKRMKPSIGEIESALKRLERAVAGYRKNDYCLKLWSQFIRLRDGNRCVACHASKGLSAHHIVRKSLFSEARYQTGNGITLCNPWHSEPHKTFNAKPDLGLPMDAQRGEKLDLATELFHLLLYDARDRGMLRDDFYYLSEKILQKFKFAQGIDPRLQFPGGPVEQVYLIWRQTPRQMINALLGANGISLPNDFMQSSPLTIFYSE